MTTTPEPSTLQHLLTRVEAATGADRVLDADLFRMETGRWRGAVGYAETPFYTASTDAALALVERLHLAPHVLHHGRTTWDVSLIVDDHAETEWEGRSRSLPLAILAALLRALVAQETDRKET